jgi:hypothetical protein
MVHGCTLLRFCFERTCEWIDALGWLGRRDERIWMCQHNCVEDVGRGLWQQPINPHRIDGYFHDRSFLEGIILFLMGTWSKLTWPTEFPVRARPCKAMDRPSSRFWRSARVCPPCKTAVWISGYPDRKQNSHLFWCFDPRQISRDQGAMQYIRLSER